MKLAILAILLGSCLYKKWLELSRSTQHPGFHLARPNTYHELSDSDLGVVRFVGWLRDLELELVTT